MPAKVIDGTAMTKKEYGGCRNMTAVVWYEIEGGGHRWPPHQGGDALERFVRPRLGVSSQNIDASEVIWEFFKAHPKP